MRATVSALAQTFAPRREHTSLEHEAVLEFATADDVASGAARVASLVRDAAGAARVEWWNAGELVGAAGDGRGRRQDVEIGRGGSFAVFGGCLDLRLASRLAPLMPLLRRRLGEERLAQTAIRLAQRNEALEDFAALVAHELKTPLHAALAAADAQSLVEQALDLVDAVLEAAHSDAGRSTFTSAAECVDAAVEELGAAGVEVTAELVTTLPMPPGPLRILLRNLLKNAAAAGARRVHVTTERSADAWRLQVDDDGVGLDGADRYASGSGLGLSLCRRMAARFGGVLELTPRASGGTRATLVLAEVPR